MKLRLSKQKLILFLAFFFVFLIGVGYLLFGGENGPFTKLSKRGNSLEDFVQRCGVDSTSTAVTCEAFLVGETEFLDQNTVCFHLIVFDGVDDLKNMSICEKPSSFEWENPYGDYEKHVPVLMEMSTGKTFLGTDRVQNITFTLMEDQEIFNLLDMLPEHLGRMSYFQSLIYFWKQQEIINKGYYIIGPVGSDIKDLLVLPDAKLEEISAQGGEVVLSIRTRIYGEELRLLTSTEDFLFSDPESIGTEEILIDVEGIDNFSHGGNFSFAFKFDLEELEVQEYLKSLSVSEERDVVLSEEYKLLQLLAKSE
jgi:hypothetical protein